MYFIGDPWYEAQPAAPTWLIVVSVLITLASAVVLVCCKLGV